MGNQIIDRIKLNEMLRSGKSQKEAAEYFGVTPAAITKAKKELNINVVKTVALETAHKVADRVVMLYPLSRLQEGDKQMLYDGTPNDIEATADRRVLQFVRGEAGERLMEMRQHNGTKR